jgi:hypothetical protein
MGNGKCYYCSLNAASAIVWRQEMKERPRPGQISLKFYPITDHDVTPIACYIEPPILLRKMQKMHDDEDDM